MKPVLQDHTYNQAKEILNYNSYEVVFGRKKLRRVVPSREYYVHQWKWDSAVHAMGLMHIDEAWAFDEIRSLLLGQWRNGFIGHIIFNPEETSYFPGAQFWETHNNSTNGVVSSGITQPPVLTMSVLYLYKHAENREKAQSFIQEILPAIIKYHEHLKRYRDPENCGLVTVIHPWESGTDNSPRWDSIMQQIDIATIPTEVKKIVDTYRIDHKTGTKTDRPSHDDYYRYIYLLFLYKNLQWDYEEILKTTPFAVKDVLFNAVWSKANESLAEICSLLGKNSEAEKYHKWAKQTKIALQNCWDGKLELFTDIDVTKDKHVSITENTIATFMPFLAGAVTEKHVPQLLKRFRDPLQYGSEYPVPTTALNSEKFELTRYWRGPTMPMTNFLLIEGFNNYLQKKECIAIRNSLIKKTFQMIKNFGFYEYYDPLADTNSINKIRAGRGFGSFSWTAAIYIYLWHEYPEVVNTL